LPTHARISAQHSDEARAITAALKAVASPPTVQHASTLGASPHRHAHGSDLGAKGSAAGQPQQPQQPPPALASVLFTSAESAAMTTAAAEAAARAMPEAMEQS